MQHILTPIANTLIGTVEKLPTRFPFEPGTSGVNLVECTIGNFPAGLRKNLIMYDARMSTSDGENHLLSFGEFCAMQ